MKDNMYTLLNDMDIQVEGYETSEVSPEDLKRWKKAFRQNKRVERKRYVGRYVAVAAMVLICTLALGPFQRETYAHIKTITSSVQEGLGLKTDLSTYDTVVGKTIAKDGVVVTVNDVVLDGETLIVSYTTTSSEKIVSDQEMSDLFLNVDVYVNGRNVSNGSAGGSEKVDDYNILSVDSITLDNVDIEKENYYKLVFCIFDAGEDAEISFADINKIGSVEFAASGEKLAAETTTIPLEEVYEFPNGDNIKFTRYTYNAVGPKIYCESENGILNYDVLLKGEDNLGNELEFYLTHFESDSEGWFILIPDDDYYIREEATSLTISLYAVEYPEMSGEIENNYQVVGEPFTIELK